MKCHACRKEGAASACVDCQSRFCRECVSWCDYCGSVRVCDKCYKNGHKGAACKKSAARRKSPPRIVTPPTSSSAQRPPTVTIRSGQPCCIGAGFFPTSTLGPAVQIGARLAFFTHGHQIGMGAEAKQVKVYDSGSWQRVGSILCCQEGSDKDLPDWGLCVLDIGIAVDAVEYAPVASGNVVACKGPGWVNGTIAGITDKDGYEVTTSDPVVVGDSGMAVVGSDGILGIEYAAQHGKFWVQPWGLALAACKGELARLADGFGSNKDLAATLRDAFDDLVELSPVRQRVSVVPVPLSTPVLSTPVLSTPVLQQGTITTTISQPSNNSSSGKKPGIDRQRLSFLDDEDPI